MLFLITILALLSTVNAQCGGCNCNMDCSNIMSGITINDMEIGYKVFANFSKGDVDCNQKYWVYERNGSFVDGKTNIKNDAGIHQSIKLSSGPNPQNGSICDIKHDIVQQSLMDAVKAYLSPRCVRLVLKNSCYVEFPLQIGTTTSTASSTTTTPVPTSTTATTTPVPTTTTATTPVPTTTTAATTTTTAASSSTTTTTAAPTSTTTTTTPVPTTTPTPDTIVLAGERDKALPLDSCVKAVFGNGNKCNSKKWQFENGSGIFYDANELDVDGFGGSSAFYTSSSSGDCVVKFRFQNLADVQSALDGAVVKFTMTDDSIQAFKITTTGCSSYFSPGQKDNGEDKDNTKFTLSEKDKLIVGLTVPLAVLALCAMALAGFFIARYFVAQRRNAN